MRRELRFGVITIQNVPWPTLADREMLERLATDNIPKLKTQTGRP